MIDLARRVRGFGVSPTVAMAQLAAARRARGLPVIDFTVGEPDRPTPPHVIAAAEDALRRGLTRYTSAAGLPELRAAVAHRYHEDYRLALAPEEVMICCGGKHALYVACQALLGGGDEVVIPSPHWPSFEHAVRLAGARPVIVATDKRQGFGITPRLIARAIGPRTKAIVINSPANPTSAVIEEDALLAIAKLARRKRIMLFFDDAYARLIYGETRPAPLDAVKNILGDRLVILGTASKTYCMTGWRIGWMIGARELIAAGVALASHSTQCPTSFAQVGAVQALTGAQDAVAEMAAEYMRRRDFVMPMLRAISGVTCAQPAGGFYAFPNVRQHEAATRLTTVDLAHRLLEQHGVGVVPGEAFGEPGFLRISFARPREELILGIARLAEFLKEVQP